MVGELPKKSIEKRISNLENTVADLTSTVKDLAQDVKNLQPVIGVVEFAAGLAKLPARIVIKNVEAFEETFKDIRSKVIR